MPDDQIDKPSAGSEFCDGTRYIGDDVSIVISQGIVTCFLYGAPFFATRRTIGSLGAGSWAI